MIKRIIHLLAVTALISLVGCSGEESAKEPPVIPTGVTDPAKLTQLAVKKQEIGAFEDAIILVNKALEIDPVNLQAHYRTGLIYEEWGKKKEAVQAYQTTLKLDPNHVESRLSLASTYGKQLKNELAIMEYEKAALLKPKDAEILFKIALEYWYLQKLPQTAEYYQKVIDLNPDHLQAHLNLASVFERMKKYESALKEISISLQLGKKTGNQQAISIAENKLLFLKGRMNLTEEDWKRKTSPPFE